MRAQLLALFLIGCGNTTLLPGPDASGGDAGGPRVELGTGTSAFVAIPEAGAELELIAGPQGGFHVDLTARIWDLTIDGLTVSYEATPVGAGAPISFPTQVMLTPTRVVPEGDHYLRAGDFLQFDVTGPPDVVGTELDVRVHMVCVGGASAEDTKRAIIVDRL